MTTAILHKAALLTVMAAVTGTGFAETRIVSSEVKLNERLSRAEATVKVEGWTSGEQVRIRLCVDRDARSTPVTGDGTYVLATPLRNPKGFTAKEPQFAPSVTLVKDDLRHYDEGTDPLDRARLHFLAPNGPAKPAEAYEKSKDYGYPVHQYPTYTGKPEWVMPVGAGELSAMVSFGTNEWHLNLSKTDYFISPTMKPPFKEAYRPDMCSPGHVVIRFDDLKPADITAFDQEMDVKRGRITLKVTTKSGAIEAELWGDRETGALVGSVADGRKVRSKGVYVEIANGHRNPGMLVHAPGSLVSRYGRLQVLEDSDTEHRLVPRWGRYYATELALIDAQEPGVDLPKNLPDGTAAFVVRKTSAPWRFAIKSAAGRDSAAVRDEVASDLAALRAKAPEELTAARDVWWSDFWAQSRIDVTGDVRAAFVERLWYQQLYVWAGVGYGKVPPKFNGGAGLVLGDSRSWGAGVWTQNTRELCWPLGAANHREFMRNFVRFYESCRGNFEAKTRLRGLGIGGFQMAETIASADSPFLVATTNTAAADVTRPYVPMTSEQVKAWRELRAKKQGMGQILSSGTEILQQMVDYVRYYGDETFVPAVAAWLRAQTEMYLGATEKGADGKWHVYDTFENESWACPEDCLVDVCAARFCFGMTAKLGAGLGYPANLVAAAKERFENFADLPTGEVFEMDNSNVNSRSAKFVPGDRLYVPFRNPPAGQGKSNVENNELYAVYPFTMGDHAKNVATFRQGSDMVIYGWEPVGAGWGWYPVPMWAARLALPDAADFVYQFAVGNNTWPFGGGRSPASIMYKGAEVEDCPYLDSAGVLQAATQELFLQSHAAEPDANLLTGGPIRLLPGVPKTWSGSFKLLARGGFEVECVFAKGVVTKCIARSTRGGTCAYVDPASGETKRVPTSAGDAVVICGAK